MGSTVWLRPPCRLAPTAHFSASRKDTGHCRTGDIVGAVSESESESESRRARFELVVQMVGEPLRRYAARRTDAETAKDVVADTFLVIWRRLEHVPEGGELPWCYAVARNCLANADRSARRQRGLVTRISRLDPPRVSDDDGSPDLPDPAIHRALTLLSADDRELLRLWAWEDLRPVEIAVVLDTTANAVSIRLHRARKRLADLLDADPGKPPPDVGHKQVREGSGP